MFSFLQQPSWASKQTKRGHVRSNTDTCLESPLEWRSQPCGGGEPLLGDALLPHLIFCSCLCLQMQCCGLGHPQDFSYYGNGFEAGRAIPVARAPWFRAGGGMPVWAPRRGSCSWPPSPKQRAGAQSCPPSPLRPPAARGGPGSFRGVPAAFKISSWVFGMAAGGSRSTQCRFVCHPPKAPGLLSVATVPEELNSATPV